MILSYGLTDSDWKINEKKHEFDAKKSINVPKDLCLKIPYYIKSNFGRSV